MELTLEQAVGHGTALAAAGDFPGLEPIADALLAADPAIGHGWIFKAAASIGSGRAAEGLALIDAAGGRGLPDTLLAVMTGRFLLDAKAHDQLAAVADQLGQADGNAAVWLYFAGCGSMMAGDEDRAFACFDAFNEAVRPLVQRLGLAPFIEDQRLNLVLRQGRLVAGPDEVERRIAAFDAGPLRPDLEIVRPMDFDAPVFIACANGDYFDAFGDEFTRRFMDWRADARLHLQVSRPTAASEAGLAALAGAFPGRLGYGVTREPPFATAAYYTCERFFVAEHLLRQLGRAVVTFDLDVTPTPQAPDFHAFAETADFACFETGRNEPASVLQASAMVWNPGPASLRHLHAVQAFCLGGADIHNPSFVSWMIDQAALISVRHYFQVRRPGEVRFADLRTSGTTLERAFETFAPESEKQRLKNLVYAGEGSEIRL